MRSKRRNGKLASCEPCRKNKTACDHTQPVCRRCVQRKIATQCYYHPAPLTRQRNTVASQTSPELVRTPNTLREEQSLLGPQHPDTPQPNEPRGLQLGITIDKISYQNTDLGYLGPISSATILSGDSYSDPTNNPPEIHSSPTNGSPGAQQPTALSRCRLQPQHFTKAREVLNILHQLPFIDCLIRKFYAVSQVAVVAEPLVLNAILAIQDVFELHFKSESNTEIDGLINTILENTLQPLQIPSTTEAYNFHELFTGDHLRLEVIGLLYTIAGRSCKFYLHHDQSAEETGRYTIDFVAEMMRASDSCLEICKSAGPSNDLTIWLLYENMLLSSLFSGDCSPAVWTRLGELSTEIFATGMHREPRKTNEIPTFLLESRRRLFVAAYQSDKCFATFLGRPPRLSFRYTDCKLPLDLSDEDMTASTVIFEEACKDTDVNGWNTKIKYQRSSWIRLRFIFSTFREEILNISFENFTTVTVVKLNDVLQRSDKAWEEIPTHLHYTPQCWTSNIPPSTCLRLLVTHLAHLNDKFLIQQMLNKYDQNNISSLLAAATELLAAVLSLSRHGRGAEPSRDFSYAILLYGLSCASVIGRKLQDQTHGIESLPPSISRSELIQKLSVFTSDLEWVARPNDANYSICQKACKVFSRILDDILDGTPAESNFNFNHFEYNEISGFLDIGTPQWMENMDWGTIGDQVSF